jgi:hypothetical protein
MLHETPKSFSSQIIVQLTKSSILFDCRARAKKVNSPVTRLYTKHFICLVFVFGKYDCFFNPLLKELGS